MAYSNWIIEVDFKKGVCAKIWTGFKETRREDINHMIRNSRELLPPLGLKGEFPGPGKMWLCREYP